MLAILALVAGCFAVTPLKLAAPWDTADEWTYKGDVRKESTFVSLAGPKQNEQGSVWTSEKVPFDEWTLEATIKVFADKSQPTGRSGLALWYTNAQLPLGTVHGATDRWDGLSVMVDSLGKVGGAVRGHLNDGSYRFETATNLQEEALSLCVLPYRDSAAPITLRIGYGQGGFAVDVNKQRCFVSTEISLPRGFFGISAESASSSDQFVVERLEINSGISPDMVQYFGKKSREPVSSSSEVPESSEKTVTQVQKLDPEEVTKPILSVLNALKSDLQKDTVDVNSRIETLQRQISALESMSTQLGQRLAEKLGDQSLATEIASLRSHISEQTQAFPTHLSEHSQKLPSLWQIVLIVVVAQTIVFWLYSMYTQRSKQHEKLL